MKTCLNLQKKLGISSATVTNWLKTGVIPPYPNGRFFEEEMYLNVLESIKTDFLKLQKRANRSKKDTNSTSTSTISNANTKIIIENLSTIFQKSAVSLSYFMFSLALNCLKNKNLICIENQKITSANENFTNFLNEWQGENANFEMFLVQFEKINFPTTETDFLGSVYEMLRSIQEKSAFGAFFTPIELVKDIKIDENATVLDPCAGTGTLLLGVLKNTHKPQNITLRDIDTLALRIAKVNFALFFNNINDLVIIENKSILFDNNNKKPNNLFFENTEKTTESFDYILTNPPYGAKLSDKEKAQILYEYPTLKTTETFSIALYNAVAKMAKNGKLCFILPESILYVDTHFNIRKWIFSLDKNIKITYFGNAFKGIMSKIIRLEIENTDFDKKVEILNKNVNWLITNNFLAKNAFRPPFIQDLIEIDILNKILKTDSFTLENQCKFGLGIVTGNNAAHLKTQKNDGLEAIFTGKELCKFQFRSAKYYINFDIKKLQQVAPENLYRQPKICYCFITDKITTVADTEGVLVLNSINFFIPNENLDIKALSAFLNSDIITFIYKRLYNATKVLKNHFENMPIPKQYFDNENQLTVLYQKAEQGQNIQNELNELVGKWYGLSENEINHIAKK